MSTWNIIRKTIHDIYLWNALQSGPTSNSFLWQNFYWHETASHFFLVQSKLNKKLNLEPPFAHIWCGKNVAYRNRSTSYIYKRVAVEYIQLYTCTILQCYDILKFKLCGRDHGTRALINIKIIIWYSKWSGWFVEIIL